MRLGYIEQRKIVNDSIYRFTPARLALFFSEIRFLLNTFVLRSLLCSTERAKTWLELWQF